jgi:hypothetical protein
MTNTLAYCSGKFTCKMIYGVDVSDSDKHSAYYGAKFITAVKSLIVQLLGSMS